MSEHPITDRLKFRKGAMAVAGSAQWFVVRAEDMAELESLCRKLAGALQKMHDETLSVGEGHDGCCHCPRCFAEAALAEFDRASRSSQ